MLEKKLLEELNRYKAINKYGSKMIMEQEVPPAPEATPTDVPPAPEAVPTDVPPVDAPLDVPPAVDDMSMNPMDSMDSTEEIDITDLVNMTKNIKNDLDNNKQDNSMVIGKMDDVFTKLTDLEQKLSQMDQVMAKIDELGSKVEMMKPETPQEKLEMRSLDSYPFNQKPQEFFEQKQGEMQATGKNEYVLTKDDVQNYSQDELKTSFNPQAQEDEFKF
jgi:hypothetical protein